LAVIFKQPFATLKNLNELQLYYGDLPTKGEKNVFSRDHLLKPNISPYLVYLILKELFGEPNGEFFDDSKSQWQWLFTYEDFYIEIYDWKLTSTSIGIYHELSDKMKSEELAKTINKLLLKASQQKNTKLKMVVKEAKHKILQNPFVTYYSTAENLLSLTSLIEETITATFKRFSEVDKNRIPPWMEGFYLWERQNDLYRSAFLMFLSSFEGFLNILYELCLKPELRSDRLYDKIFREQIDIKLRLLPVYCNGFNVRTVSNTDERFKNYMRLVNLRNDFVHANLIKSLERYVLNEDNKVFIIENEETSEIPTDIELLGKQDILLAKKYIDDIIELVFESMNLKTRKKFKKIIYQREIQVRDFDGVFIPL
jgi:hypothetical protein